MSSQEITLTATAEIEQSRFMPVMAMAQAVQRYNAVLDFTQQIMKAGKDYGTVPGVEKPSLLKPGAEKLCSFFGLTPQFSLVKEVEEWTGDEPFFYYFYKCRLFRGDHVIAEGDGSCNSRESKYRYRWVGEDAVPTHLDKKRLVVRGGRVSEFVFAIDKAETSGKYGKPASYWQAFKDAIDSGTATQIQKAIKDGSKRPAWEIDATMFRVPNPDVADQVNTIQKMAQKRSLVAATLIACNASEYYTQDVEDMEQINQHVGAAPASAAPPTSASNVPTDAEPEKPKSALSPLDTVLATFGKKSNIDAAFQQLKGHFLKVLDPEVWDHQMEPYATGFKTVGEARKAFTAIWKMVEINTPQETEAIPEQEGQ